MRNQSSMSLPVALLFVSCASGVAQHPVDPTLAPDEHASVVERSDPAVEPSSDAESPLEARWTVVARAASSVLLRATIEPRLVPPDPLVVTISVPDGATLARGNARESIVLTDTRPIVREYELRFAQTPATDAQLDVDIRGTGYVLHARDHYHFERPVTLGPRPSASAPHVVFGQVDLGPSIPATR